MMTIHLCQSSEKLNWNQIKQSILGRQRLADKFTCAGCSRSFETICCLHFHCMKHNEGGSYYFDHVTSTAFPKLDTRCSATQFEAEDFNDDGRHKLKVLVGNVTSLKPLTSRCLNKENNTNVEEIDGSVKNISNENGTCVSDGDTTTNQEVEVTSGNILDEGTKEGETDARMEEEKREGFARVKVRNIERREDGSISFEMNEADAHLFQATANTLIEQMRKKAGDLPIPAQELEVMVPDDSLQVENSKVSEDPKLTYKQAAVDPVNIQEKDRSTTVSDVQEDQDTDTLVEYEIYQDKDVNSKTTVDIEIGEDKDNSSDIDRRKNEIVKRSSQRKILGKANDLVEMKMDSTDDIEIKSNRKLCNKKKERNVDDASPDKDIEKIGTKTGGKNSELVDKKQNNNFVLEYPVYTRSQRKRKLTTRMKESELPEMLKLTGRTPQLQETKNEELTLKRRKSLIGETDFNAGETLLALRETRDLKSMKSSNRKTGLSTFSKDKDKYYNEEVDFNADKTSDHEVTPNEDSDADKIDGAIVINDLRKGNGNDGSGILTAHSVCNEEEEEEIDDEICDGKEEDLEKTIKRVYPKKQRRKRLKKGQMPLKRRNDFKCNECGKVGSLSMIKYHEQMHSDKMPYKCEDCGKCFKTSACKRSHMLQHGEKKWKCEQCPAAFYRKQYLDVHMTNHTGEYPYVCELCGMKFKMAYIVRRHVNNVHKNIRNYKCDICDKEFFRVATRDQHRNRHFDPFLQCSYCPKKFKGDLDLRKHELTHTGEKMYFCPICNQGFTQIWPYYKHMWKIHNIEKEEAKKMKIRNPDIVNMRNVNKDSVNKEQAYVHEFIGKPGCTFDMRKSFNQNVNQLKFIENKLGSHQTGNNEDGKQICETSLQNEGNAVYTATEADVADTIVMNIGGDLDNRETIVIQTEELQSIGNQQTGYIVVENSHGEDNIVIYSGMPQNEAADVHQFIGNC